MIQSPDDAAPVPVPPGSPVPSLPALSSSPALPDDGQVTGRAPANGRRVQRTVNFDRELLDRARAAATWLAHNEPTSGIRSLADIVNPAVAERVAELEAKYNDGQPFAPVFRMPPGRRPDRTPAAD